VDPRQISWRRINSSEVEGVMRSDVVVLYLNHGVTGLLRQL
jgi:hypothetical protein